MGNSDLHCMLLFGRDGVGRQTIQRVRFAKRLIFENRISLRDGLNYSHQRLIDLDSRWTLGECGNFFLASECHPLVRVSLQVVMLISLISLSSWSVAVIGSNGFGKFVGATSPLEFT